MKNCKVGATRFVERSDRELGAKDGDRLSCQEDAIARETKAKDAAARGDLPGGEGVLAEPLAPERREAAMCRSRHWVLVDPGRRCEEPRDEIEIGGGRASRGDDAARRDLRESAEVGLETGDGVFGFELDQVIKNAPADVTRLRPQGFEKTRRRIDLLLGSRGKV